jgi:2,6-dihydroxypseudooxynicotine hydrolase
MSEETLSYLWQNVMDRFLAEGAVYRELRDLQQRIARYEDWCSAWAEVGRATEERAQRLLESDCTQTAAADLWRSSIYYFFAQFLLWDDAAAKRATYADCARVFRKASNYLDAPQQPIEIPYRDITMLGYLRLPPGIKRPPCVLLLNGLDTTKEEQLVISNLCIQRGLATISFDGPGQGETFYNMKMTPDYVQAVQAALDFAESREEIDTDRLGIIGRSLGSHYAAHAAMLDRRIKAVVAWGSMFNLHNYRSIPPLTLAGFVYVTGSKTLDEARPYLESIDLARVGGRIKCPLMVVNGGRDPITPRENIDMMQSLGDDIVEVLFWEDGSHCAHDRPHICRPAMADFMRRYLAR